MKKMWLIVSALLLLASCSSSKVSETAGKGGSGEKHIARQAEIRQAVEMRRFLIKFDRLYFGGGGRLDLVPKANYIILDGDRVIISAAYAGRQFSSRPISGIDMIGKAVAFEMRDNTAKGLFEIRMKVKNESNTFDVYLTISSEGYCDTSLTSYKIDHIRYTGNIIPLKPRPLPGNEPLPAPEHGESAGPRNMSI